MKKSFKVTASSYSKSDIYDALDAARHLRDVLDDMADDDFNEAISAVGTQFYDDLLDFIQINSQSI